MAVTISGSTGISSIDGSAASPGVRGGDANTGVFYSADAIKFATGGVERAVINNNGFAVPGHVIQVLQNVKSDTASFAASTTYSDTGLSQIITPSSASSKILCLFSIYVSCSSSGVPYLNLVRGSTNIAQPSGSATNKSTTVSYTAAGAMRYQSYQFLDSPNTINATTYKVQIKSTGATSYINRYFGSDDYYATSTLTLMEIAG
mgnify:CR=1 FL=1|tara:strand:- start:1682 stop:2293 length:612 start_codon:yes stop_codon:yes gene_type:complete